ncbi:hypothetical protein U1Q18_032928, partial [Sarracenia purpurea var. burkii]
SFATILGQINKKLRNTKNRETWSKSNLVRNQTPNGKSNKLEDRRGDFAQEVEAAE